jgi:hypothetical protein
MTISGCPDEHRHRPGTVSRRCGEPASWTAAQRSLWAPEWAGTRQTVGWPS